MVKILNGTNFDLYPASNYMFQVSNRNIEEGVKKICLKLTIKTPEELQDLFLVLVLLTFSRQMTDE